MSERVDGKVVVITGASAGIGRAAARAFARRGCRLALLARGADGLEATRREVDLLGGTALPIATDVADEAQVEAAAVRTERELGPIDVWVNNAMTTVFARFIDVAPEEYRRVTEVTYFGTVWGTHAALRRMVPRDRGTVVQVGSALAHRAIPLQSAYCGAKHAIRGFTDSIRSELIRAQSAVHLTMVQLPAVNTPQFTWCRAKLPKYPQPVPPIYQPEIAADSIVWSAEHRRRELSVGMPTVRTILGAKLAPGWLDHYLADAAWEGQLTERDIGAERPDNLWDPVPGDQGAHGEFDARSREQSPQLWANERRAPLLGTVLGLAAGAVLGYFVR